MSTLNTGCCGALRFAPGSGTWTWSEHAYTVYGLGPGEVVPTTGLMVSHQHPDDRDAFVAYLAQVCGTGVPSSLWHRLLDAHGAVRQVLTTLAGERGDDGRVLAVTGHVVDVTEEVRRTTAVEVDHAMGLIGQSRPVIEQAKGALMASYVLDADAAFALLRGYSQHLNVKVRDVARDLVDALSGEAGLPLDARADLARLATQVRAPAPPVPVVPVVPVVPDGPVVLEVEENPGA